MSDQLTCQQHSTISCGFLLWKAFHIARHLSCCRERDVPEGLAAVHTVIIREYYDQFYVLHAYTTSYA